MANKYIYNVHTYIHNHIQCYQLMKRCNKKKREYILSHKSPPKICYKKLQTFLEISQPFLLQLSLY